MSRVGLALACLVMLISLEANEAQAREPGWNVECKHTKFSAIDPITRIGSHTHDFFGNSPTARATVASLQKSKTNCTRQEDRSGYWAPALIRSEDGARMIPDIVKFYYRASPDAASKVRPAPRGLKIVAGNSMATSPQGATIVSWDCQRPGGSSYGVSASPVQCFSGNDTPRANIIFPECWNGKSLDSPDHKSHMAYGSEADGSCPPSHPVLIPQLTMSIVYPPLKTRRGKISMDTARIATMPGSPAGAERYSLHADWMNAWKGTGKGSMTDLTNSCIHKRVSCGAH